MPEVRIKTDFGEVVIPYNNMNELELGLQDLDKVIDTVSKKALNIVKTKSKTGYEDIFGFTQDGLVDLYNAPSYALHRVILVLFAYHPRGATVEQVSKSSGVKQVARNYLTPSSYRKYFTKLSKDEYGLAQEGLSLVTSKIIPELRARMKR